MRQDPAVRERWNASRRGKYTEKQKEYNTRLKERHFFRWRARQSRTGELTASDLAGLWKGQRGRCALSGAKLGRDAHLDHIEPKSHGGKTELANLRWLDPWVNIARQNLDDAVFADRCAQVAEWIGLQLMEAAK